MGGKKGTRRAAPVVAASALSSLLVVVTPARVTAATTTTTTPLSPVGSVPNVGAGATSEGQLPTATPIQLSIELRSSDPSGLAATAEEVSTPGSPEYGQYLTPAEVEARFGPSPAALSGLESYLSTHGLTIGPVLADGLLVTASGPAGSVSGALHTGIARYRQRSGRLVYANTADPKIPTSLAGSVTTVSGLDDTEVLLPHLVLPKKRTTTHGPTNSAVSSSSTSSSTASPASSVPGSTGSTSSPKAVSGGAATPCAAASNKASAASAYTADQIAGTYGFDTAYKDGDLGKGQTIAVFELAGYSSNNLQSFERCYGLDPEVRTVRVQGGDTTGAGTMESELDIETVMSLAPKAKIMIYEAPPTFSGALAEYGQIASDDKAQVVSTSWGGCEPVIGAGAANAENTIFEQMATQGQTVVAASGDTGSEDCYEPLGSGELAVDDPASQPLVTGVGGTDLASAGTVPFETAWNDNTGAGGGGISTFWTAAQAGQKGPGVDNRFSSSAPCAGSSICREVPDVSASASADNGYVIYCNVGKPCKEDGDGWIIVGGTSAAAPLWAALVALADEMSGGSVGDMNPLLYEIAQKTPSAFHDITQGNNDYTGTNNGAYPATSHYDMATGLGSPNGHVLLPLLHT